MMWKMGSNLSGPIPTSSFFMSLLHHRSHPIAPLQNWRPGVPDAFPSFFFLLLYAKQIYIKGNLEWLSLALIGRTKGSERRFKKYFKLIFRETDTSMWEQNINQLPPAGPLLGIKPTEQGCALTKNGNNNILDTERHPIESHQPVPQRRFGRLGTQRVMLSMLIWSRREADL